MTTMMGDVQVVGLVPETVQLADIGLDVAHGIAVWIPGEKATASKDLWRAISQRRVFKLSSSSPIIGQQPVFKPQTEEIAQLKERIAFLEKENAGLQLVLAQQSKIEDILTLLRSGQISLASGTVTPMAATAPGSKPATAVVEVETPAFIPSQIKSDTASDARVTVTEGQTEGGGVSNAQDTLRKLRKG